MHIVEDVLAETDHPADRLAGEEALDILNLL